MRLVLAFPVALIQISYDSPVAIRTPRPWPDDDCIARRHTEARLSALLHGVGIRVHRPLWSFDIFSTVLCIAIVPLLDQPWNGATSIRRGRGGTRSVDPLHFLERGVNGLKRPACGLLRDGDVKADERYLCCAELILLEKRFVRSACHIRIALLFRIRPGASKRWALPFGLRKAAHAAWFNLQNAGPYG